METRPMIHSQADLESVWRTLMSPLGFGRETLWLMFIDPEGEAIAQLTELEDAGEPPGPDQARALAGFLGHFGGVEGGGLRVAFLRSRPGNQTPDDRDRAWASILYDVCREAELPCEVVHLATDRDIYPMPLDALPARSA